MRTLFAKIFLWFWLAMAVVGITSLITTAFFTGAPMLEQWLGAAFELYAQNAVEQYEKQGREGLIHYFDSLQHSEDMRVVVLDPTGNRLLAEIEPDQLLLDRAASEGHTVCRIRRRWTCALYVDRPSGRYAVEVRVLRPRRILRGTSWDAVLPRVLLIVLASGALCFLLARYIARPLRVLQEEAQNLANGDFSARAVPKLRGRNDEIMSLARDFDAMADRIQTLMESQKRMFADISHELRSPLTRIGVAIALSEQGEADALSRIHREIERLNELIDRILLISKLDGLDKLAERREINLAELIGPIAEDARYEAAARGVEVVWNDIPNVSLFGDDQLLRSAIENVARNAVRYAPSGSKVEIDTRVIGSEVVVRVCDRGPGVPEESLAKIFDPFYRAAEARDRLSGGAGLWLAITQRAVKLHGGTVRAFNREGGGLEVEIYLPITKVPVTTIS